jgi:MFS family permease
MASGFSNITRVFKEKNYLYYFSGQTLSLFGTWMQSTALSWLVYRLTGSSKMLGLMGFINTIPALMFSYLAGVVADKISIKKGLYVTQSLAMFFAFLLGFLTVFGSIKVIYIFIIGFTMGIVGAFDAPFRQSFVIHIVPRAILHNAIALNSTMVNIARIIGPMIAGFMIKYTDEGWCFILNGISYFFIIVALYKIIPIEFKKSKIDTKDISNIKDSFITGLKYISKTDFIRYPITFMFLLSFVTTPIITLMPVYVKKVGGDSQTLGMLMAIIGLGAVISCLDIASMKKPKRYIKMINKFSTMYGIALIIIAAFSGFKYFKYLSYFMFIFIGMGMSRQAIGINTVTQTLVSDEVRGRVISVYTLSFTGLGPLGNLFWGYLCDKIGILNTIFFCGIWIILINFWFYINMSRIKKEIYTRKVEWREEFEVL